MDLVRDKLRPEDLNTLRSAEAKVRALRQMPGRFAPEQAEEIHMDYFRVMGDIVERYEVDETENWLVSFYTGRITYLED